jgi:hypothetical protein
MNEVIRALGTNIENTSLTWRHACELRDTSINRAIVDEAIALIDADVERLSLLHSKDVCDWKVKADVLIRLCGSNPDPALYKLAVSLALDVVLSF